MKKLILSAVATFLLYGVTMAQVAINTDGSPPEASAMLDVNSTNLGFLPPRLTQLQMNTIPSPAEGLMVYCTDCTPKAMYYFDGTGWITDRNYTTVSATGRIWMDRNLGAERVATSSTDAQAYGDMYQWGRLADGHQKRTSGTTTTLSTGDVPGHGNFILAPNQPYDWRSPQNDNLWQGLSGTNNPCPSGYRIPTTDEWDTERQSWSSNDAAGAYASPLKLTMAGTYGRYWTSGISSPHVGVIDFFNTFALMNVSNRAYGLPVRCIKD